MTAEASWNEYREIVTGGDYLVLATAGADGTPWASPVFFRADERHDLLWVSVEAARHSRNIAVRPQVAATIFDSTVPVGSAQAVYVSGRAEQVGGAAAGVALGVLNRGLPEGKRLTAADLDGEGALRVYRLAVAERFVLARGSDPRATSGYDTRLPVAESF
jgi:uncharacterized protein YhbP (UPF0306 family)